MSTKVEYIEVDGLGGSPDNDSDRVASGSFEEIDEDSPEKTERKLDKYCAKIDRRILLYAVVLCVLNQSDRGSIGVAKVVGLEEDLGMANNDFNIAATLFTVGYLSLEMFSNFVLKRVGASRLLPILGYGYVGTVANSTIASAITVFMGASSGFVCSNVFLNSDAPRFVIGHSVNIAILALGILACIVTRVSMGRRNRTYEREARSGSRFEQPFRYVY
ncbi:hypothetical protein H4R99_001377 [Coemansia sp. RSA 1722]|nr:hypothetical protein H4R99_001377 [Coemansia sp. RSA 1722]